MQRPGKSSTACFLFRGCKLIDQHFKFSSVTKANKTSLLQISHTGYQSRPASVANILQVSMTPGIKLQATLDNQSEVMKEEVLWRKTQKRHAVSINVKYKHFIHEPTIHIRDQRTAQPFPQSARKHDLWLLQSFQSVVWFKPFFFDVVSELRVHSFISLLL